MISRSADYIFDIFLVKDSKTASPFPSNQFRLAGYMMFRHDQDSFGGGLCMYVNESIPVKQLNSHKGDSETFFLEKKLCLRKWPIEGAYKPPDQSKFVFLESLCKKLSIYLDTYENLILFADFKMTLPDKNLQPFKDSINFKYLIEKPTCFQGFPST